MLYLGESAHEGFVVLHAPRRVDQHNVILGIACCAGVNRCRVGWSVVMELEYHDSNTIPNDIADWAMAAASLPYPISKRATGGFSDGRRVLSLRVCVRSCEASVRLYSCN